MEGAARSRDPVPVPFSDDGYAEYQLARCRKNQNSFDQVLTIISIMAAATVFFQRIRNKENRKFPDNIFTVMLVVLCGIHVALLISIASQNKVVYEDTQPWRGLCQLQARMFHWCSCAAIWNTFCVILTLHRVIVRKTPVAELLRFNRLYYVTLVGLPSLAVLACSLFGEYGPYPGLHNCWIEPGAGRLFYFHTFTIVTFTACLIFAPPTVLALWKAHRNAAAPANAGLFRSLMWRQIVLAAYGLIVLATFLLGGINNMLLQSKKKSSYIKRTAYPLCIFSAINFASLGLLVSVIYWSTRTQSASLRTAMGKVANYACCGRFQSGKNQQQSEDENSYATRPRDKNKKKPKFSLRHAPVIISARNVSPRSPDVREQLRSAFDSDGRSVVSIPPDPQHRAAHEIASNAYTSTLLEYVREQLLDELEANDSDLSSMYDDDSTDGRSSFGSDGSMVEYFSHTDSSYPTTPQSNFQEISPRSDAIPQHRELVVPRKATITEL